MRKSIGAGTLGMLLIGLGVVGCGSGQKDEGPMVATTQAATTGNCDDWRFWLCTNSSPAFNPFGTCGNGSGGSGCGCVATLGANPSCCFVPRAASPSI